MMNAEQSALVYASLGLRVIPLYGRSKTPRIERWTERASIDPECVTKWFTMWPDSNVAIVTGGGIIALDVDPRHGGTKSLKKLLRDRSLPPTAQAITGSGGQHFLFRVDPALGDPQYRRASAGYRRGARAAVARSGTQRPSGTWPSIRR
jgi:hypothetical protein